MTVHQRIVQHLEAHRGKKFTNRQIAQALAIPEPSVRRATLRGLYRGVSDAGKDSAGYYYQAETRQSADATEVPA